MKNVIIIFLLCVIALIGFKALSTYERVAEIQTETVGQRKERIAKEKQIAEEKQAQEEIKKVEKEQLNQQIEVVQDKYNYIYYILGGVFALISLGFFILKARVLFDGSSREMDLFKMIPTFSIFIILMLGLIWILKSLITAILIYNEF